MKKLTVLSIIILGVLFLAGCGEPEPSAKERLEERLAQKALDQMDKEEKEAKESKASREKEEKARTKAKTLEGKLRIGLYLNENTKEIAFETFLLRDFTIVARHKNIFFNVEADENHATLTGKVPSVDLKKDIEQIVKDAGNFESITNNLVIK